MREKRADVRGSAEIVWTAGPPNDHQEGKESTLEKRRKKGELDWSVSFDDDA